MAGREAAAARLALLDADAECLLALVIDAPLAVHWHDFKEAIVKMQAKHPALWVDHSDLPRGGLFGGKSGHSRLGYDSVMGCMRRWDLDDGRRAG